MYGSLLSLLILSIMTTQLNWNHLSPSLITAILQLQH